MDWSRHAAQQRNPLGRPAWRSRRAGRSVAARASMMRPNRNSCSATSSAWSSRCAFCSRLSRATCSSALTRSSVFDHRTDTAVSIRSIVVEFTRPPSTRANQLLLGLVLSVGLGEMPRQHGLAQQQAVHCDEFVGQSGEITGAQRTGQRLEAFHDSGLRFTTCRSHLGGCHLGRERRGRHRVQLVEQPVDRGRLRLRIGHVRLDESRPRAGPTQRRGRRAAGGPAGSAAAKPAGRPAL